MEAMDLSYRRPPATRPSERVDDQTTEVQRINQHQQQQNVDIDVASRNRVGLVQTIVRFGERKRDLPIDEFMFRIEHFAGADNIPANLPVFGLHTLLSDNAADFYWIQRRKNPDENWALLKKYFLTHFSKHENDL